MDCSVRSPSEAVTRAYYKALICTFEPYMRKKVIGIFFLILLFAPAAVTYGWLHLKKQAVKREVKWRILRGIDKDELTVLTFTHAEAKALHWKHSREFEYEGKMFDIVVAEETAAGITYWCYNDREETEIETRIGKLAQTLFQSDPQSKEQEQRLINYFKTQYVHIQDADKGIITKVHRHFNSHYPHQILTGFSARFLKPPIG